MYGVFRLLGEISAWLPLADLNDGKTAAGAAVSQALIGRFETACIP